MKYSVFLFVTVFAVAFSFSKTTTGFPWDKHTLAVEADLVTLSTGDQSVSFKGNVKLSAGDLVLSCEEAVIRPSEGSAVVNSPLTLTYQNLTIVGHDAQIDLQSSEFSLDMPSIKLRSGDSTLSLLAKRLRCNDAGCSLTQVIGSGCPHTPKGYEITARSVTLHPSGDLDLLRPALVLGEGRLPLLPWIRLRPPGKAGFLAPRLGYDRDAGFIFGPRGHIPLSAGYYLEGHVAVRTSQGAETSSSIEGEHLYFKADHLLDAGKNSVRFTGHIDPPLDGANFVLDLDYATDMDVVKALTFDPLERASTHLENRLLVSVYKKRFTLESGITYLQPTTDSSSGVEELLTPTSSIGTAIIPFSPLSSLWAVIHLDFNRRDISTGGRSAMDAQGGLAPAHSRISATPRIIIPAKLGIFSGVAQASTRHEYWLFDRTVSSNQGRHIVSAGGELSLPLIGYPFGLRHALVPSIRYRITPWIAGDSPSWSIDGFDQIVRGHGLEISVNNRIGGTALSPQFHLSLTERFDFSGFEREWQAAYLYLESSLGPTWLHFDLEVSWDHQMSLPSYTGVALSSFDDRGTGFVFGGNWYGPGRGAHMDAVWDAGTMPWILNSMHIETNYLLELYETASFSLTESLRISGGARLGVHPTPRFHAIWYGITIGSKCRCFSLELNASHRFNTLVPDVMAFLNVGDI